MNEMSVEKLWNEICGRGKLVKPQEKPTQTSFCPPVNPQGVTETRTRDSGGGRRATYRLRHGAALKLNIYHNTVNFVPCMNPQCLSSTDNNKKSKMRQHEILIALKL